MLRKVIWLAAASPASVGGARAKALPSFPSKKIFFS